jgi:hypothetical protein
MRQRPIVQLRDGLVGYCMQPDRPDDCLRPAVATATQIPVEQVPDPRLGQRSEAGDHTEDIARETWERLTAWLNGRGLDLKFHESVPVPLERWIGVVDVGTKPEDEEAAYYRRWGVVAPRGEFQTHCVVMSHDSILLDVAASMWIPSNMRWAMRQWHPTDVKWGISFPSIEKE